MEENVKEQHPPYNDEGTHRWTIPALGHVKLNWDTAICSQRGLIGLGVVVRDHEGAVLAVRSRVQDGFFEPLVAEAWAAGQAVQFGKEMGGRLSWKEIPSLWWMQLTLKGPMAVKLVIWWRTSKLCFRNLPNGQFRECVNGE